MRIKRAPLLISIVMIFVLTSLLSACSTSNQTVPSSMSTVPLPPVTVNMPSVTVTPPAITVSVGATASNNQTTADQLIIGIISILIMLAGALIIWLKSLNRNDKRTRIFGVAIILFGAFIFLKFFSNADLATVFTAWSTLVLALATFYTIDQYRNKEKRDRRERILIEINEWAEKALLFVDKARRNMIDDTVEYGVLLRKTIGFVNMAPKIEKSLGEIYNNAVNAFRALVTD